MSRRRALWVSTSIRTRGGIATYVRTMRRTPLWDRWHVRHIATHCNGSVAARVTACVLGFAAFLAELVVRRPAVVHLHTASNGSFARKSALAWISRSVGVPVVLHVHGGGFQTFFNQAPPIAQRYIRTTLERSDAVVALGQRWARALQEIAPAARITVVPNAVRLGAPVTQPGPAEPVRVLFLGDVTEHKGAFVLLEAWSRLGRSLAAGGAELVVAGDGALTRARSRVAELGIADTVQVRGWVAPDEVEAMLVSCHVLVLPSRSEGQPMAVLEAMAHGLCIVATGVGGIPDLVDDCGVLVPADDVAALVEALHRVVVDSGLRTRLATRAFRRAREGFDVDVTWRAVDALYEEVLG